MFDDLKKKRRDAKLVTIQTKGEEEKALTELGQLQREQYEALTPMVQEVLTQYNEAMGFGVSFEGRFVDPCRYYRKRTTKDRTLAEWCLVGQGRVWPYMAIVCLKCDEGGVPTHFKVYVYLEGTQSFETPNLSQESLIQALRQLTEQSGYFAQ